MPPETLTQNNQGTISDEEVLRLEKQGFREGDNVPGRGVLLPTGTFRPPVTSQLSSVTSDDAERKTVVNQQALKDIQTGINEARETALRLQAIAAQQSNKNQPSTTRASTFDSTLDAIAEFNRSIGRQENNSSGIRVLDDGSIDTSGVVRDEVEEETPQIDIDTDFALKELDAISARSDVITQQTIANVQARYQQRRDQTEVVNKGSLGAQRVLGFQSGRARFAPGRNNSILTKEETDGIKRLASLDAEEMQLILEAQQANTQEDFETLNQKIALMDQKRAEKLQVITDLNKQAVDQQKIALDEAKEFRLVQQDALDTVESLIDNFGNIPFESLSPESQRQILDIGDLAGVPREFVTDKFATTTERKILTQEEQRAIDNQLAFANLSLRERSTQVSESRFREDQALSALDAQRLGLPKSLVGLKENEVEAQLRGDEVPNWYIESIQDDPDIVTKTDEELQQSWDDFRNGTISSGSGSGGGGSLPAPSTSI